MDDYLQLSGIQHFIYCERQWALIHIESKWADNYFTYDGVLKHQHVHDAEFQEVRKDKIIVRGLPIRSDEMKVCGVCDAVEFHESDTGVKLYGHDGMWNISVIEYKRGKPKTDKSDILQVVAQIMCLEEMFSCKINNVFLFYLSHPLRDA